MSAKPVHRPKLRRNGAVAAGAMDIHAARISSRADRLSHRADVSAWPSNVDGGGEGDRGTVRVVLRGAALGRCAGIRHVLDRPAHRPAARRRRGRVDGGDERIDAVHADGADERRSGGRGVGVAVALLLADTPSTAFAAGIAAAAAILIRPNLVPLAAVLGLWILWRKLPRSRRPDVFVVSPRSLRRPDRDRRRQRTAVRVAARIRLWRLVGCVLARARAAESAVGTRGGLCRRKRHWHSRAWSAFAIPVERGCGRRVNRARRVWLLGRRDRRRLGVLSALRAVGRVVVSAIPAASLADDGDWHRVTGRRVAFRMPSIAWRRTAVA